MVVKPLVSLEERAVGVDAGADKIFIHGERLYPSS